MTPRPRPGHLTDTSWARQSAAEAFANGLQVGDLLTQPEADDIKEFRQFLAGALAHRGLQLQEEPDGWRVVRAPFQFEAMSRLQVVGAS